MTDRREEGFVLHWGYVTVAAILLTTAGAVLFTLGWRWLWMVPALCLGLVLLNFLVLVFEGRWKMMTDGDVARGAPGTCPDCGHALDIVRRKSGFRVRCPICGYRESGPLHRCGPAWEHGE